MKAFTVSPIWAYLICNGVKDVENRRLAPKERAGTVAVHVSKSFSRAEYDAFAARLTPAQRAALPFEAFAEMCGKVVGVVDYEVRATCDSQWWDHRGKPWCLSRPKWLEPYVPCRGQLGMWTLPASVEASVKSIISFRVDSK